MASRSSMPSVMYLGGVVCCCWLKKYHWKGQTEPNQTTHFNLVDAEVRSSNRMGYPTCSPRVTSISSLTRLATLIAATLRGCVHATIWPLSQNPNSNKNWGIWKTKKQKKGMRVRVREREEEDRHRQTKRTR